MLTIGELAKLAGTTVRAVRHYHGIGLIPSPRAIPRATAATAPRHWSGCCGSAGCARWGCRWTGSPS
jgi:hypothetical protein